MESQLTTASTSSPTSEQISESIPTGLQTVAGYTWRLLIVLAGVAVVLSGLNTLFPVAAALFFALLVTAWTGPVMRLFERALPKVVSMILALVVIAAGVFGILTVVIRASISEGANLAAAITQGFDQIRIWLTTGPLKLSSDQFQNLIDQARAFGQTLAKDLAGNVFGAVGSLGTLIIASSVFLFGVIFFLMTPDKIWNWLLSWFPSKSRTFVDTSGRIFWESVAGYTRGIVVVALLDAVLVYLGLLVLRVPLAPALAAVVFLGAFIPVIGAPFATFFAAVVALAECGPTTAVLVILLTIAVGSFDGDVLQPLVMGKAVNLHPLAIVVAIAAGGITLGILGALVAVPLAGGFYGIAKYATGRDPEHPLPAETMTTQAEHQVGTADAQQAQPASTTSSSDGDTEDPGLG
jgi:predicted PurR-regulated permease PerM